MKQNSTLLVMGIIVVFAFAAVIVAFKMGSSGAGTTLSVTGGAGGGVAPTITLAPAACDPQSTINPELRYALVNMDNPNTQYLVATTYVYEGAFSKDNLPTDDAFITTYATVSTGMPAVGSGVSVECGKTYTIVAPASTNVTTSTMFQMTVTQNSNNKIVSGTNRISNQTYLIARVYNDEAKGFVYADTDATAGSWHAAGSSWYSTTGNASEDSDGLTLGADGYYRYTISIETNATATTTARFNDQETTIAIDRQSMADWDQASTLSLSGVDLIGNKYTVPSKLASLNFDDAYLVPDNPAFKTSVKDLKLEQHALNGVNPDDNVVLGVFTAGYSISSKDNHVVYGYAKDNPTTDIVYDDYFTGTLVMG